MHMVARRLFARSHDHTRASSVLSRYGLAAIASMLQTNKSIRLMSLRGDGIDDGGAAELGRALRHNTTLEGLS